MSHNEIILSIQFQNILVMYGKACIVESLTLQTSYSTHGPPKSLIRTFNNSPWRHLLMSFYELGPKTVAWSPKTSSNISGSIQSIKVQYFISHNVVFYFLIAKYLIFYSSDSDGNFSLFSQKLEYITHKLIVPSIFQNFLNSFFPDKNR